MNDGDKRNNRVVNKKTNFRNKIWETMHERKGVSYLCREREVS